MTAWRPPQVHLTDHAYDNAAERFNCRNASQVHRVVVGALIGEPHNGHVDRAYRIPPEHHSKIPHVLVEETAALSRDVWLNVIAWRRMSWGVCLITDRTDSGLAVITIWHLDPLKARRLIHAYADPNE